MCWGGVSSKIINPMAGNNFVTDKIKDALPGKLGNFVDPLGDKAKKIVASQDSTTQSLLLGNGGLSTPAIDKQQKTLLGT